MSDRLFEPGDLPERLQAEPPEQFGGRPRLRHASREQIEFRQASLDQLLPPDVDEHVGRRVTDPSILLARWIYATFQGEESAREIDRLCHVHLAYQW